MEPTRALALTLHLVGFAVWLGSLFGMAHMLLARDAETDESLKTKLGAIARSAGLRADIGATLALVGGVWMLSFSAAYYMHQPWMHAKLTLVLAMLGVHGFLRVKAKRASLDAKAAPFPRALVPVMTLLGVSIIALVVFKPGGH